MHTINQAICDGQIKAVYEKEKEEWVAERMKLLKDNREIQEQLSNVTTITMKQSKTIQDLEARLFIYSASNQAEYKGLYSQSQYENRKLVDDVARLNDQLFELQQEIKREDREKCTEVIQRFNDKENELKEEYAFKEKEWKQERRLLNIKIKELTNSETEATESAKQANDSLNELMEQIAILESELKTLKLPFENKIIKLN